MVVRWGTWYLAGGMVGKDAFRCRFEAGRTALMMQRVHSMLVVLPKLRFNLIVSTGCSEIEVGGEKLGPNPKHHTGSYKLTHLTTYLHLDTSFFFVLFIQHPQY